MAPLENIIWEAKQRPGTLKDSRRPSTTVDDNGCIITRGFVIPSRSSSIDSVARSSISSVETVGTPASPVDEAPPGLHKPTGALNGAPELQPLKTHSPEALCRPTKSDGNLTTYAVRPQLDERRRTWQVDRVASGISHLRRGSSSRWHDNELEEVTCQPDPPSGLRPHPGALAQARPRSTGPKQHRGHAKRVRSAHVKLNQLNLNDVKPKQRKKNATEKAASVEEKQALEPDKTSIADAAIASESENDFLSDGDEHAAKARPHPNYANYAERRAKADGKVPPRTDQILANYQLGAQAKILPSSLSENAIESDDEDDDIAACKSDRKISARLSLAQIHCTQNALATKADPDQLSKRRKSPLSVSIAPPAVSDLIAAGDSTGLGNVPAEVNTFEPDVRVAHRELRPSRTQPRPARGVLKNTQTTGI